MADAETRLLQALETFEELGDPSGMAWSRGLLAYVRINDGRFVEAEELARRTLVEARDRGDRWAQGMMHVAGHRGAVDRPGRRRIRRAQKAVGLPRRLRSDRADPGGRDRGPRLVRSGRIAEGMRLLTTTLAEEREHPGVSILETSLAAAAATVGDTVIGRRRFREVVGFDPDRLGESDQVIATALLQLQQGDIDGAWSLRAVMPDETSGQGSTWGWAVLALTAAARGDDVEPYADLVESSPRSTYADRALVRCALACAAPERATMPGPGSRSTGPTKRSHSVATAHPTIVALAEAQCLVALDAADAAAAEVRAIKTASALGLDSMGWRTAFARAWRACS
ncbi:MAG: hypothetical protein R2695_08010 [Acidimicrobiales bacterium]